MAYDYSPAPINYSATFGGAPGTVAPAPSIYQQVNDAVPGLPDLTGGAAGNISAQLSGKLSPETINNIKDQGAAWGYSSGMPGSGIANNFGLRNLGLATESLQQQGIGNYLNFLTGVGSTMTNPAVTQELAMWNATNNAAPNPAAANQFLMNLLNPPQNNWDANHAVQPWFTPAGVGANAGRTSSG